MLKFITSFIWRLLIFGLIAALALLTVDLDSFKPQVEAETTMLLRQPVHVHGSINVGLLGVRPALVLHKVDVGAEVKADKVVLTLQGFKLSNGVFVHADGLSFKKQLLGNYDIPVAIKPSGFEIYPLEGGFRGSSFTGKVKYVDGKLHIDGTLKKLPLVLLADDAEGEVEGNVRLDGTGDDEEQLMHTLNGRVMLSSGSGKLTSKSLNFWSRGLLASLLPGQKDATLNCAILDFNIGNGAATSRAIIVDTNDNTVFAKGNIDLGSGKIDMTLRPNPKKMELVSFATPVHVTGSVDNAVVTPEAGGVAKKIGGVLLDAVNPAFMLIPLVTQGLDDYKGSCADILKQKAKP